ncbi:F-box protein AFR-like [Arachis stenosperma]|uniref:F-box protein AFR-like n=1 Tax=Arachis stenosperma TaxID=217475 RepID=UPI0025ACEBC4|nr:F-box protein AFR-like [Arachis stenosperma]
MAVLENANTKIKSKNKNKNNIIEEPLIPGLPNEIAELCLLHLPYPYQSLARAVSSSWNRAITNPSFQQCKKTLSRPYLFLFSFHKLTRKFYCHLLDHRTRSSTAAARWFTLPLPPSPITFYGKLLTIAGTMRFGTLIFSTAMSQWSSASAGTFFAEEGENGKIVAVHGGASLGAKIYDAESDTWRNGARVEVENEVASFEAVENEGKVFVTEGWRWPFTVIPRGWVYDTRSDTWQGMGIGMREGWSGVAVAVAGRIFRIPEYGDGDVKVYEERSDTWRMVRGRFPREKVKRPLKAKGLDGKMYVAGCGLNVAIGSVVSLCGEGGKRQRQEEGRNDSVCIELKWEVVEAPGGFRELEACHCQVLYA